METLNNMKDGNSRLNKFCLAVSGLLFTTIPAIAADDDSAEYELYEITARKLSQPYIEVPVSSVVIDGSDIQLNNITDLQSLTVNLPGVFAAPNSQSSKLFVRGVGSQGNAGMDQAVSVYVDDVFHGRSRMIKGSLFDAEAVEVLKGPQGTYLGLNTTAGAFVLRTRQAELNSNAGSASLLLGDNNQVTALYAQNIALSSDAAVRAAARVSTDDGYWDMIDNQGGDSPIEKVADSGVDETALRLSGVWQATENLNATLKLEYQNIDKDNPFAWQPGGCDNLYGLGLSTQTQLNSFWSATGSTQDNPLRIPVTCRDTFIDNEFDENSPSSPFNTSEFEYLTSTLRLHWQRDNLQIIANTAWFDMEYQFAGNDLSHGTPSQRLFYSSDDNTQLSQEIRLLAQLQPNLLFTTGAYWHSSDTDYQTADADGRNRQNPRWVQSIAEQEETRTSLFAALEWNFWQDLSVDLGYRWSQTDKDFNGVERRIQFNQLPDEQAASFSQTLFADTSAAPEQYGGFNARDTAAFDDERTEFTDQMPSASLIYQPDNHFMAYYKWSKAAKSGGFNFRLNNLDAADLVYEPEEVIAQEIGVKSIALDGRLQMAVAVFNSNYSNLQQNSNRGDDGIIAGATIRNIARADSDGVELNLNYLITEQLSISWTASWLDAEFVDYQGADCTRLQSVVSRTDVAAQFGVVLQNQGQGQGQGQNQGQGQGQTCEQNLSGADMHMAPDFSSLAQLEYQFHPTDNYQLTTRLEWFYSDGFFTSPHADPLRYQPHFNKLNFNAVLQPIDANWQLALVVRNLTDELTSRQLGQDGNASVSGLIDPPRYWAVSFRYDF